MPQLLTLSRAARIAGVTRSELQQRLRDRNTEAFEGKIRVSDLLQLYPDVNLDSDPVFERVQRIKTEARPKSEYTDGWMPDPEVLLTRLKQMNRVLVKTKAALYDREQLLGDLLEHIQETSARAASPALDELRDWLDARLREPAPEEDKRAEIFARNAFFQVLAPSVRISPSGHEFFVEGNDTILEAGLKAGLNLDYGCSNGNCGACKTRVIAGKVKEVRPHDFMLSAQERDSGQILACSWTAVTDIVLEAAEARQPQDLPLQEIRANVSRIEHLSPELALLQLKTPRSKTLRFMAGQGVELSDDSGNRARYSLASCPCDGRNLQFFVERRDGDAFSQRVFDGSLAGQPVQVTGPEGTFVLQDDSTAPAVFVAIDNGFSPVRSLVEHAISIDHQESLNLFVAGWPERVPHIHNLCRAWRDALDDFHYRSIPEDATPEAIIAQLEREAPELSGSEIYIAGPVEKAQAVADGLRRLDALPADQLRLLVTDGGAEPA